MVSRPDWEAARRHIKFLTDSDDATVAWQIFDETKQNPKLAQGFHGTLAQVRQRLIGA